MAWRGAARRDWTVSDRTEDQDLRTNYPKDPKGERREKIVFTIGTDRAGGNLSSAQPVRTGLTPGTPDRRHDTSTPPPTSPLFFFFFFLVVCVFEFIRVRLG